MTGEGDGEQRGLFELFQVLVKEDTQIQRFATQKKVGFASSCVAAFKRDTKSAVVPPAVIYTNFDSEAQLEN